MFEKEIDLLNTNLLTEEEKESLTALCSFIVSKGSIYLVGGCVRDLLLNKKPKDFDFCTSLKPEEVKQCLKDLTYRVGFVQGFEPIYSFIDTGLKHGTITAYDHIYKISYEITTYRVDGKYEDNRHPTEVTFTPSLEEDLKRRDFTINSFAYDIRNHKLIMLDESYLRDLEYGIIRTVGNPVDRFKEDALRMLRAIRFAAQLNFTIQSDTYHAIEKCCVLLNKISKERIRDELTKILMSDKPDMLKLFVLSGLEPAAFDCLMPLANLMMCEHQNPWHYADVFHHTMDVVNGVPKTFELRWAALFHDFGKPATKQLKEGTTDHYSYHGHEAVSAEMAEQIMDMLKFPNEEKETILKFVKYHDTDLVECKNSKFKKVVADIGKDKFFDFIKLKVADSFAHRLLMDTKYAVDYISALYDRIANVVVEDQALKVTDLNINGYDLMELGYQGKEIGDCLSYLLDIVLEDSTQNKKELLINYAKEWRKA